MSIQELIIKIKGVIQLVERQDIFMAILVILVGFSSFGLGKLSSTQGLKQPVFVQNADQVASVAQTSDEKNSQQKTVPSTTSLSPNSVVASKTGTKYHYPWCIGAKSIKEENKVWFSSIEEARNAGYLPAGNCKGLK